eukprot:TRINITY_DN10726_c0_g1_i1.p1 TRINITY_DN10726_c0_g1~~TRINITY_DN10726_c0_g1_i1.p1  ORF type:complete len:184 (+),score=51.43 TRINITY_DN10726_c0_g1_i1:3-554(+)
MPLSELQKKKVEHLFRLEDVNGNGVLEENDFVTIARKQLLTAKIDEHSSEGQQYIQTYKNEFAKLAAGADTNKDGKVTLEEFTAFLTKQIESNNLSFYDNIVNQFLAAADLDKDGKVSLKEYVILVGAVGINPKQAEVNFSKFDTNKNGFLEADEFKRLLRAYFTTENPEDVANHFLAHQSKE